MHAFTSPDDAPRRPVLEPSMDHLHPRDRVRLREDYLDLPRGAVGVVIGFYRTQRPVVSVAFECGVRKVPFDRLEPLGDE
jgi:hypothetical protein